ncbi:hypothetical protein [Prosthecobacter sp.]|uniref:hypothetical protein n=1 Tax=Prosthecobacter sp. TaxID=1965333 RepID=UPI002ABD09AD|nr:hypothetical protein [Prosthecobacter sp.]MDZ4405427.1 hypothetical protein [Prosthecobacter sp.]
MRDFHRRIIIIIGTIGLLWMSAVEAGAQSATTQAATGVTDIAATLRGQVTPGSTTNYRYVRFEYWAEPGPISVINGNPYDVIGTMPVSVTASPPGLLPNTTYHYRVVLSPSQFGGGWVGEEMSFTTGPAVTLPAFQSAYADIIGDTLVNFVIWNTTSGGSPATTTFEYGPTASYGAEVTMAETMATNTTRSFAQINATGLTPGTTYHYRVKVTNEQGVTTSADATFTTTLPATVTTGAATGVTSFSASVAGSATPLAHTLQMIFEYGTSTSYGSTANATPFQVSGGGTTNVSAALTDLLPGMTYHYRLRGADSWNDGGYYDGADMTFATPSNVTSLPATAVTDLSATANGTVDTGAGGGSYSYVFEYGTTASYGSTQFASQVQSDTLNPNLKIASVSLSQLLPGTVYHYRLRSTSNGHITYGEDVMFTTSAAATPPMLGTPSAILSPRYTTATSLAVSLQTGSSATTVVFDYGLDTNYGFQAVSPTSYPVSSSSLVGETLTGLTPGTTYHFRTRATNNEGTTSSADVTFTTLPVPDVTTNAASPVGATSATLNGTYHMHEGNYTVTFEYGRTTAYGSSIAPGGIILGGGGGGIIIGGGGGGGGIVIGGGNTNSTQNPAATVTGLSPLTTYHYCLKLADNIGNVYYGADATFTTVAPVEAWRQQHFGVTANAGDAADTATPAGDGIPNLMKFALGMSPAQPGVQPPVGVIEHESERYLSITFPRNPDAMDLTYEVQAADSPSGPWTTVTTIAPGNNLAAGPGLVAENIVTVSGGPSTTPTIISDTVIVRDTVSLSVAPRRFMRLLVVR